MSKDINNESFSGSRTGKTIKIKTSDALLLYKHEIHNDRNTLSCMCFNFIIHVLAGFGFAMLFFTFAMTTQGYHLGASTFILSVAVASICIVAMCGELYDYYNLQKPNTNAKYVNAFNAFAFLFAAVGCGLIGREVSTNLFHAAQLPRWMGALPPSLFVGATILLTVSAFIRHKQGDNKISVQQGIICVPFILQTIGATFLVIGACQVNGLSPILPHSGQSLHHLNNSITTFATIGGIGALATIAIVFYAMTQSLKTREQNPLHDKEIISTNTDDINNIITSSNSTL